ncbi:protease HtpX [Deltaproteobacteria bacterium]|nr:protease HtpX [Deltaproteobacteria bacterium]
MINSVKTAALLAALTGLLIFVGRSFGGAEGMILAFILAMALNLGSWWFSDRIVLAMYRAVQVTPAQAPQLHSMVAELAARAGLPMPKVYVVPGAMPNAFATGRNPAHAAVAVTEGILQIMPMEELRGVLAHELAHVKNRDTLTSAVAAVVAGAISMMANMLQWSLFLGDRREDRGVGLLTVFLAPLVATVIQLAISRSREYAADEFAARLLGDGRPLARALQRLEAGVHAAPGAVEPSTAHLFIVSPLSGRGFFSLFRTHPHTADRVARLERITAELDRSGQRFVG